jgi:hypothetical protein
MAAVALAPPPYTVPIILLPNLKAPCPPSPPKSSSVVVVLSKLEVKVILMTTHVEMKVLAQGDLALPPTQARAGKLSSHILPSKLFFLNC